jgi:hypothetical protein
MSNHPQAVAASPSDFGACAPSVSQEFVQIPKVEHIMVQQPVTYTMYKKKVTMVNVPVVQSYSKVTMGAQEVNHCGAAAAAPMHQVVNQSPPVYGCKAGPYRSSSYGPVPDGEGGRNIPVQFSSTSGPGAYYYAGAQPNYPPSTTPKSYAALY